VPSTCPTPRSLTVSCGSLHNARNAQEAGNSWSYVRPLIVGGLIIGSPDWTLRRFVYRLVVARRSGPRDVSNPSLGVRRTIRFR
jgi:hypothetical protein